MFVGGASDSFSDLASLEAVRLMIDALLSPETDEPFTQDDLHELVGLPPKTVWMHVEWLTNLGILEMSGGYVTSETNLVLGHVRALDAAVLGAALSL